MKKIFIFLFFLILVVISPKILAQELVPDETSGKKNKKYLFIPIVLNAPETKIGLGCVNSYLFKVRKDSLSRTSNVQAVLLVTQKKQIILEVGSTVFFPGEKYIFRWQGIFTHFPDKFYGLSNNSLDEHRESYTFTEYFLNPQLSRRIYSRWFLGVQYEFQNVSIKDIKPKGMLDTLKITGSKGGVVSGIGPMISWDSRNNAFSPNKGEYFQFAFLKYSETFGSNFEFRKFSIDARKYYKSFSKNVFAAQFYAEFNTGLVPFRSLVPFGGPNLMRGYYAGRYKDKEEIILQGEYRMPVWRKWGVVGFGGLGEVSDKVKNFTVNGIKYSLGGGIRFAVRPKEKLNIRFDYAIGKHSHGAYLYITEAF